MKASELIKQLSELVEKHGDHHVDYFCECADDGVYFMDADEIYFEKEGDRHLGSYPRFYLAPQ